jgi:Mg/Co/Ni transporter MgtE
MRPVVFFRLLDQERLAERTLVHQLLRAHVLGREQQLLGVQQQHAFFTARCDHLVGFG